MRFVIRAIGLVILAVGVVFAIGDIARSLADDTVELLSVAAAAEAMGLAYDPGAAESAILEALMANVGPWSAAVTAGVFGLVLIILGRPRRSRRTARYVNG